MKRLWRNYSLSITLAGLFFVSWIGQLVTQWFTWANDQQEHNQSLEVGDFLWQFWTSTLENWQSEFLQLLTFVVLTTFLIHRNSHESRDSDDEMQKSLDRDREAAQGPGRRGRQDQGGQQLTSGGAVMENTTTAILTGLGTMLVGAAVLAGLVWLAHRLADRS